MALVSSIPKESFQRPAPPEYLTYAMATIGSVLSPQPSIQSDSLWSAATVLIALALEIDNRQARNWDLVNAVRYTVQ